MFLSTIFLSSLLWNELLAINGLMPASTVLGAQPEQTGNVYQVRWPDGRRFDSRRRIDIHQAQLLVDGGICEWVKSPTGIPRYLRMKRSPSVKQFATMLAQGNFTTTTSGNLHEHVESKRKGL